MERVILVNTLGIIAKRYVSTVSKPTITVPLKWQKKMARNLVLNQEQNRLKKSQQGNTKVKSIKCLVD